MSETEHPWCRDVSRDEAVRAAEDAAAAKRTPLPDHRDLPSAVAELRERVARLEALVGQAAVAGVLDSVGVPPSPATRPGETTAKHPVPPADRLRTERVVLEIVYDPRFWHQPSTWAWKSVLKGRTKTVRVVEETAEARRQSAAWDGARQAYSDGLARLTAERDAARAECERLKEQIVALEGHSRMDIEREIAVETRGGRLPDMVAWITAERDAAQAERDAARAEAERLRIRVAGLEAASAANARGEAKQEPEPRGWLTAEERQAVAVAATTLHQLSHFKLSLALRALLDRSSPPRVKVPNLREQNTWRSRDDQWIDAIREAGGEVQDG